MLEHFEVSACVDLIVCFNLKIRGVVSDGMCCMLVCYMSLSVV